MAQNDTIGTKLRTAVSNHSAIDYLAVGQYEAGGDKHTSIVVAGRDCPTEHANDGEPLAAIDTTDGDEYAVCYGEGQSSGWDVTDLQGTGMTLEDAVELAAVYVTSE